MIYENEKTFYILNTPLHIIYILNLLIFTTVNKNVISIMYDLWLFI